MQIDVTDLSKKMEEVDDPLENVFAITESLYYLDKTCPEHGVGERNLILRRYTCWKCGKLLKKVLISSIEDKQSGA